MSGSENSRGTKAKVVAIEKDQSDLSYQRVRVKVGVVNKEQPRTLLDVVFEGRNQRG